MRMRDLLRRLGFLPRISRREHAEYLRGVDERIERDRIATAEAKNRLRRAEDRAENQMAHNGGA